MKGCCLGTAARCRASGSWAVWHVRTCSVTGNQLLWLESERLQVCLADRRGSNGSSVPCATFPLVLQPRTSGFKAETRRGRMGQLWARHSSGGSFTGWCTRDRRLLQCHRSDRCVICLFCHLQNTINVSRVELLQPPLRAPSSSSIIHIPGPEVFDSRETCQDFGLIFP